MFKLFRKKEQNKAIKIVPGYEAMSRNQFDYNFIEYGLIPYKSIALFKKEIKENMSSIILIKEAGIVHAIFHEKTPIHRITYDYCDGLEFLDLLMTINKSVEYYLKEKEYPFEAVKRYVSKRIKHDYADSDYMSFKGDFLILKDENQDNKYNVYDNEGEHKINVRVFESFLLRIDTFQNLNEDIFKNISEFKDKIKISDLKNELEATNMNYLYNRCCLEFDLDNKEKLYLIDGVFAFGKNKRNLYYKTAPLILFKNKLNKDFEKLSVEEILDDVNFEILYKSHGEYLRASEVRDYLIDKRKTEEEKDDFNKRYKKLKKVIFKEIKRTINENFDIKKGK